MADGKTVNTRVDEALVKRTMTRTRGPTPARNHPWRNRPLGTSATGGASCHSVTGVAQVKRDIATLQKRGHFYLALTSIRSPLFLTRPQCYNPRLTLT